ncbi:NB-ARC domain-containing protein [Actinoplanes sp. GCM10030250]|uniref:NB-ARC domain-containing protein n=1 Tax=Actinoplanes sp. GCM10030250 TaxID=3273376 RepID=UPI003617D1AE
MRRRARVHLVSLVLLTFLTAVTAALAAIATNAATDMTTPWPWGLERVRNDPFAWTGGAVLAGFVASLAVWWVQHRAERQGAEVVLPIEHPESWVLDRPQEVDKVVAALWRRDDSTVGITTALQGAGGFGKTTIAKIIRSDPRIRRRFGHRVYWVTLGRDLVSDAAIAARINDLMKLMAPDRAQVFTDARQAGAYLGSLLDEKPRRLLILDDVWFTSQLTPFVTGGRRCARLVTTRIPSLLGADSIPVEVDRVSAEQAKTLLEWGLPTLPDSVAEGLIRDTGRWPLLLRLVNMLLAKQVMTGARIEEVSAEVAARLHRGGGQVVDDMHDVAREIDLDNPEQRQKAVRATIRASSDLLTEDERHRLDELGIFVEDELIPVDLVYRLWHVTAGLDQFATRRLVATLRDLALLVLHRQGEDTLISLHDVIRDYLRERLGSGREATLHGDLLDDIAARLPAHDTGTPWWLLPDGDRYVAEHLVEHLVRAGRLDHAEELAGDLRWVEFRLASFGIAAPDVDLAQVGSARANRLRAVFAQVAHLVGVTTPKEAQRDILHSRVQHTLDWGPQVARLDAERTGARLANAWPLPDLPEAELRRSLMGHSGPVTALALTSDGKLLISGGTDRAVRVWDTTTGDLRLELTGHAGTVRALRALPGNGLLASGGDDRTVIVWDLHTGQRRAALRRHRGSVQALDVARDGTFLIAGAGDELSIWSMDTRRRTARLRGRLEWAVSYFEGVRDVRAVAVAPTGRRIAAGRVDGSVEIWDVATRRKQAELRTSALIDWTAEGKWEPGLQRRPQPVIPPGTDVTGLFFRSDGRILVEHLDRRRRVWDPAHENAAEDQSPPAKVRGRRQVVTTVMAPDGSWIATGEEDGAVHLWDSARLAHQEAAENEEGVNALAVHPAGQWLLSAGARTTWLWNLSAGTAAPAHVTGGADTVAFGPDGTWVVVAERRLLARYDIPSGNRRWQFDESRWSAQLGSGITAVTTTGDGWIVCGWADGEQTVHAPEDGGPVWTTLAHAPRQTVTAMASVPGHTTFLVGRGTGAVGVQASPSALPDFVRTSPPLSGEAAPTWPGHAGAVRCVAASGHGWFVTGGDDATVRIWKLSGAGRHNVLTGHRGAVRSLAVAPDDRHFVSGGDDQSLRIWDSGERRVVAMMRVNGSITSCAWAPDGRSIIAGGSSGLYRFAFQPT